MLWCSVGQQVSPHGIDYHGYSDIHGSDGHLFKQSQVGDPIHLKAAPLGGLGSIDQPEFRQSLHPLLHFFSWDEALAVG